MARLFVAVWPPDPVLDRLDALERGDEPGVRWTGRDQWHVTLRFLGRADPTEVVDVLSSVREHGARATVGPRIERLGASVVVAPVSGLDRLAAAVRTATAHLGQAPDLRPFVGHITLARLRGPKRCGLTGAPIDADFVVGDVALVASDTRPEGARYTELARFPLELP